MGDKEKKIGCETLVRTDPDGTNVYKAKKNFDTLDDAIYACKRLNIQEHRISKVGSYKCKVCIKYHIGRTGKTLDDDYKSKLLRDNPKLIRNLKRGDKLKNQYKNNNNWINANFKVVGKIDLSKIPSK